MKAEFRSRDVSRAAKNALFSMRPAKNKKPAVDRKRAERARKRAAGLVAVTVHVSPAHRAAIRMVETLLNGGGTLTVRLVRYLAILADKLPARVRARASLTRVTPKEAKAAIAELIDLAAERRRRAFTANGNDQ
ncbi:MAG: hypothetical protein CMM61_15650 [Rhodospirillaceae bacterium]|nr:hypothetical protein [Rhodospirillaceae bacterium]